MKTSAHPDWTPALMLGMQDIILDRISFDGVKELEELYFD